MTETFTASNGVTVIPLSNGLTFELPGSASPSQWGINRDKVDALREYFAVERDRELGRWRSTVDRRWTAVRREKVVYFQCEDGERSFSIVLGHEVTQKSWAPELRTIAREYLDAHPEPKPAWHDAKPGEVWVLNIDHKNADNEAAWQVATSTEFSRLGLAINKRDERITDARRIWPTEVSDG